MSFFIYDVTFLGILIIVIAFFLYRGRKNLSKEGPLILYKTKLGIKLIDYIGKKYKKTLKFLSYVSIASGYALMISVLGLLVHTLYIYLTTPIAKTIKAPPIAPLIPYFPKLFGLSDFFPPFYATYFIISILIVATVHEFSHGIFMRRYKIKIKSTGFAFFKYMPLFLGAFVEQDEKNMKKKRNFEQMSVLSAGTFANLITAGIFFGILLVFFHLAFSPAGVVFNSYAYSVVSVDNITSINGVPLSSDYANYEKILSLLNETGFNKISVNEKNYLITKSFLKLQKNDLGLLALYDDYPAIRAGIIPGKEAITKINGFKTRSYEEMENELKKYSPGEKVTITTYNLETNSEREYQIILAENPEIPGKPFLGIGFNDFSKQRKGFSGLILKMFYFKEPNIYYKPKIDGLSEFIYNMIYWISLINLLVALVNMIPAWIFDGGMFSYLTVLSITKSEESAKKFISWMNKILLLILIILMIKWAWAFFF